MFIQPDWLEVTKAGVGTNRYAYSFNDPVNGLDPNGNAYTSDGRISPEDVDENDEDALRAWIEELAKADFKDGNFDPLKVFLDDGTTAGYAVHFPSVKGLTEPKQVVLIDPKKSLSENEFSHWVSLWTNPKAYKRGAENALLMATLGMKLPLPKGKSVGIGTSIVVRPHGNSALSTEVQMIYKLVTNKGVVLKYGITKAVIGKARYTQKYLDSIGATFEPISTFSGRALGYAVERGAIIAHEVATGARPILNKFYR